MLSTSQIGALVCGAAVVVYLYKQAMLSTSTTALLVCGVALSVFLNYPAPPLSPQLSSFKQKGKMFIYKGLDVFYIDEAGQGDSGTVICLHGFPSFSYDWIKVLPALKRQFSRIVMIDFLGMGFSDKPEAYDYSIFDQADLVETIASSFKISTAHILSHDYGDTVALELVARYKERIAGSKQGLILSSLCLLNAGLFPGKFYPLLAQRVLMFPFFGRIVSRFTTAARFKTSFGSVFGPNRITDEDLDDFYAAIRYNDGNNALPRVLHFIRERAANGDRWVGALSTAPIPVLMVYGPCDPVNPPDVFPHEFRRRAPQHKLVELDASVGHYPQWEDPDNVSKAYLEFIGQMKKKL